MDKILNKILLLVSMIVIGFYTLVNIFGINSVCGKTGWHCFQLIGDIGTNFLWVLPAFFLSLITLFMRKEVFYSWFKFACVWVPISMVLVAISPDTDGGGMLSFGSSKALVDILTSYILLLVGLVIIISKQYHYWRERKYGEISFSALHWSTQFSEKVWRLFRILNITILVIIFSVICLYLRALILRF